MQDLLRASEERYRKLVENANDLIVVVQDLIIKFANSRSEELIGYSNEEMLSVAFTEFIHPDDRQSVAESDFKRLRGDKFVAPNPVRVIGKRGQVIWMDVSAVVIEWEGKRATLNFLSDITERKNAEAALRESEALYSVVVNRSTDGITIAQGTYLRYANPAILTMTGYSKNELLNVEFLELIHPDDRETLRQRYIRRLSGEPVTPMYEARIICKDGTIKDFEISGTFIQYKDQPADLAILRDVTERNKTRNALSESEQRYRSLIENALEAVVVIQDGSIKYANPRAFEIIDYPGDQSEPIPFEGLIHPDDRDMVVDRHLRRLKGEKFETAYAIRIKDRNNGFRWVQISTALINWDDRPATLTFLADISENKQWEKILEIQRDLGIKLSQTDDLNDALRSCLEAAMEVSAMDSGGIYLVDDDTGDLHLVYSIGLSEKFLAGVSHFEASSAFAQLIMNGRPVYIQHSKLTKEIDELDPSQRLKLTAAIPVYRGNRVIACLNIGSQTVEALTSTDRNAIETIASHIGGATDRIQSREALRASEEKYRNLVELLHEGIWVIDERARTTYVNTHMADMLGYTTDEMLGKELFYFMDEQGREIMSRKLERRRQWITERYDFQFLRKDGLRIDASIAAAPIKDKDGRYKGVIAGVQDITDHKRLEEEQQRVEKLESVGLLAGGIAHDFNNILTAILGNINLARMEAAPGSEILESLEQAEKASLRARDLTQQLLTFSKGGTPVKKLASLAELLRDTAGFALRGSNVKCTFLIPVDLWHAEIDAGQISQVIHNLVINAQQAMPTGGTIEVSAKNMIINSARSLGMRLPLNEGNYVRIAVTDHGSGIPADHLDRIFDPFFTTKQKGSGLGLATSFPIARHHGGHLSVESEPGSGSTFYLYLPASTQTSIPGRQKKEHIKPAGKARILVMDDEKGVREVSGRMLSYIGYDDVEFASGGAEAVMLYKAAMESGRPFSLVILDLTIPGGMGGKEAIRHLLEIDPGVKAIVSSGYAEESVMAEYKKYGFCGMVAKPYTLDQLGRAVHDVIGQA